MTTANLTIGTRIFNGGDMANPEHFGTVTAIKESKWGDHYTILPDADAERGPYNIPTCSISPVYLGHGGTRIVTEKAYKEFRAKQIEEMRQSYEAMMARRAQTV